MRQAGQAGTIILTVAIIALCLHWSGDTVVTPPDPPPEPVAGAPVIDVTRSIDMTDGADDLIWLVWTDSDTPDGLTGEDIWTAKAGDVTSTSRNKDERVRGLTPGVYDCTVTDLDGNTSAVVTFELLSSGGISLAGSTPPDPLPDPVPGVTEIRLEWVAPTENDDGTRLVDLAGYRVYRGPSSGVYDTTPTLQPNSLSLVQTLPPGLYYFCVTAFDTSGNESPCGGEVSHEVLQ